MTKRALLLGLFAFALLQSVTAQVPQLINYQGRVVVGTTNFNGMGQFKFALVNAAGSTTYWSNNGSSTAGSEPTAAVAITVSNGLYSVLLGDTSLTNMTAVPATVFANSDVRLRVWFNDGTHGSQLLTPDQRIAAVGYALMAGNVSDGAITSAKLATGAVTTAALANGAITSAKLATGQAVTGVNGLKDAVTIAAGTNVSIATSGNQLTISATGGGGSGWALTGNSVGAGGSFLGTTDNQPLDFKVNSIRGLRIYDPGDSNDSGSESDGAPNLIAGAPGNTISAGIVGSTIAGGGATSYFGTPFTNSIAADFAFVGGGYSNAIQADARFAFIGAGRFNTIQTGAGESSIFGGISNVIQANAFRSAVGGGESNVVQNGAIYSVIAGGYSNSISGGYAFVAGGEANAAGPASFAAGHRAKATHSGSFVWADATDANFATTANNQMLIRASGGVGIGTNAPGAALEVAGQVKITGGSPGTGKVLMSDTSGLAAWQPLSHVISTGQGVSPLEIAGQIKITGGSPGAGKVLVSDANGNASWQSLAELSLGQNYTASLPYILDNSADLEIEGYFTNQNVVGEPKIVVISGPGWEIPRVGPNDMPGLNREMPFVFEYAGANASELEDFYENSQTLPEDTRAGSIIFRDLAGEEVGRWNFYQMLLTSIEPGSNGRLRYTMRHQLPPNNQIGYERWSDRFDNQISINPATDTFLVEIEGINQGGYPVVETDYPNRTITLTFDSIESEGIYEWTQAIATGTGAKRRLSLVTMVNEVETARRRFYGAFPISYQQSGFGQFEKMKEKVVLSFDHWLDLAEANATDNSADLELEGVMQTNSPPGSPKIVVVNGPGFEMQRVPGFSYSRPNDTAGPNTEMPFVFEYAGPDASALQAFYESGLTQPEYTRSLSILLTTPPGPGYVEVYRWNLYDMLLTSIEPGTNGRLRYTMRHQRGPNNILGYQRDHGPHGTEVSINPATDSYLVEISGVNQGGYPAVDIDYTNRTLTMTFDSNESGDIYVWVRDIAQGGSYKRDISLVTIVNGVETARRNFYGVFPIGFQQTTGFGQSDKLKEKVVISFDYWQEG